MIEKALRAFLRTYYVAATMLGPEDTTLWPMEFTVEWETQLENYTCGICWHECLLFVIAARLSPLFEHKSPTFGRNCLFSMSVSPWVILLVTSGSWHLHPTKAQGLDMWPILANNRVSSFWLQWLIGSWMAIWSKQSQLEFLPWNLHQETGRGQRVRM